MKPATGKCKGIKKNDFCYDYVVLKEVCMILEMGADDDTGNAEWRFVKGCFDAGSVALYEKAEVGKTYDLDDVKFELRLINDLTNLIDKKDIVSETTI